jgi:hypothetical protein
MAIMATESDYEIDYESLDEGESLDETAEPGPDESEFLGPLLSSLPIIGPALGGLIGGAPRPPLPPVPTPPGGTGVSSAVLNTPRGAATLRLPEPAVTQEEFNRTTASLRAGINRNTTRLNTTHREVSALTRRVGVLTTETKRDIGRVRTEARRARRDNQAAIAKLKRDISSQSTMSMLMGVMGQQQVQSAINAHTHAIPHTHQYTQPTQATAIATPGTTPDLAAGTASGQISAPIASNPALMLMPMLLAGGEGGLGGGDSMMPLMMMMMFMRP